MFSNCTASAVDINTNFVGQGYPLIRHTSSYDSLARFSFVVHFVKSHCDIICQVPSAAAAVHLSPRDAHRRRLVSCHRAASTESG